MAKNNNIEELKEKLKDIVRLTDIIYKTQDYADIYQDLKKNSNYAEEKDFDISDEEFEEKYLDEYYEDDKISEIRSEINYSSVPKFPDVKPNDKPKLKLFSISISKILVAVVFYFILTIIAINTTPIILLIGFFLALLIFTISSLNKYDKYKKDKKIFEDSKLYCQEKMEEYEVKKNEYENEQEQLRKEYEERLQICKKDFIKKVIENNKKNDDARGEMYDKQYCESPIRAYESLLTDDYIPYANRLYKYLDREQAKTLNEALILLDKDLAEEEYHESMLEEERRKTEILEQQTYDRERELRRHNAEIEAQAEAQAEAMKRQAWAMEEQAEQSKKQAEYAKQQVNDRNGNSSLFSNNDYTNPIRIVDYTKCLSCRKCNTCSKTTCTGYSPKG